MSAWDRKEAVERYAWRLRRSSNPTALMRHLGTPTKVAVELAKGYVPSPQPSGAAEAEELPGRYFEEALPDPLMDEAEEEQWPVLSVTATAEEPPESLPWTVEEGPRAGGAGRFFFLLFAIVIGVPVALVLLCVGLPFVIAGAAVTMTAAAVMGQMGALALLSDVLLLCGSGLILLSGGVLLIWIGVWLGVSLSGLWLGGVVGRLGRRVYGEP